MAQGRAKAKYRVKLTEDEREYFHALIQHGRVAGWKIKRAQAMLKLDESDAGPGWSDAAVAEAFEISTRCIENWRKQAVEQGPLSLLERKARDGSSRRKLDGAGEAQLIKLACSTPPDGRSAWTTQLLADKLVELNVVEDIGRETVRVTLKKRDQALAQQDVVHPARAGRGLRGGHGTGPERVRSAL